MGLVIRGGALAASGDVNLTTKAHLLVTTARVGRAGGSVVVHGADDIWESDIVSLYISYFTSM